MIIAQERAFLKAQRRFQALEEFVEQAAVDELRMDRVERELFSRLLAVGLAQLQEAFVAARGDGNAGQKLETIGRPHSSPVEKDARATLLVDLRRTPPPPLGVRRAGETTDQAHP